jgi:hypothetical protein
MNRLNLILLAALSMGTTTPIADEVGEARRPAYEYSADAVDAAAANDLDLTLAPFRQAGKLNRATPELARAQRLFAQLVDGARQRSHLARKLDWALYLHDGKIAEAYSRAGGKVVISSGFLERYRPNDAELAFVLGHEVAHVLCEHERMNLSAVWRRNAPQRLQARYAMEFLDTEPVLRAELAPITRLQERVADRLGLELAAASGTDPVAALGFFDKGTDEAQDGGIFPDVHDSAIERKSLLLQAGPPFHPIAALFHGRETSCAP